MEKQFTCMIIDDEPEAVDYLASLLADHCPALKLVASANGSEPAVSRYFYHLPDLLFMDIKIDE